MLNLTQNPDILQMTEEIRKNAVNGRYLISDIIKRKDGFEYQFVDLVMEGGGTLGIALVGYIHALEQAGIRFLGIGGSSVGAIVSLLTYGCGERTGAKGEKIASIMADMNLGCMVDGKFFPRELSKLLGKKDAKFRNTRIAITALLSLPQIFSKLGLNPGDMLYEWIKEKLKENGISCLSDLRELTDTLPDGLIHRHTGEKITNYDTSLKIVAADITTSTKVVFPDMAAMYWQDPAGVNPACFARASASIPFFFQPFTVSGISGLIGGSENWKKLGSFTGALPDKVSFADGGLISNFPIDLFHRKGKPRAPTLGARLGSKYRAAKEVDNPGQYARNMFKSMRHYADYDFIYRNPLHKHLITHIPTHKYNWLDFNMSDEDKLGLFKEGVAAGFDFLEKFDWEKYKALRAAEFEMYKLSQ